MRKGYDKWLTSTEVRKTLKISTCDLAHLRTQGAISHSKKGNAYLYSSIDVAALKARRNPSTQVESCSLCSDD